MAPLWLFCSRCRDCLLIRCGLQRDAGSVVSPRLSSLLFGTVKTTAWDAQGHDVGLLSTFRPHLCPQAACVLGPTASPTSSRQANSVAANTRRIFASPSASRPHPLYQSYSSISEADHLEHAPGSGAHDSVRAAHLLSWSACVLLLRPSRRGLAWLRNCPLAPSQIWPTCRTFSPQVQPNQGLRQNNACNTRYLKK